MFVLSYVCSNVLCCVTMISMNCCFTIVTLPPSEDSLDRKSPSMSSSSGQWQIYETVVETVGRLKMGKGFRATADVTCRAEGNSFRGGNGGHQPLYSCAAGKRGLQFEVVIT